MPLPDILRELVAEALLPEAIVAPQGALPKVDPAAKQQTSPGAKKPYTPPAPAGGTPAGGAGGGGGGMPSAGGPAPGGEPEIGDELPPEGEEGQEGEDQAEESKQRFSKHMEAAHYALALSEYHCGRLQEMKGLQEMDDAEGEKISAAHKVICDTRAAITEMWSKRSQSKDQNQADETKPQQQ